VKDREIIRLYVIIRKHVLCTRFSDNVQEAMDQHQRHLSEIPEETSREKRTVQERRIQIREPVNLPATIYEGAKPRSFRFC